MLFDLDLAVTLRPIWHQEPPLVRVGCLGQQQDIILDRTVTTRHRAATSGQQQLTVQFLNKTDRDTDLDRGLDKAVVIDGISFFGIHDKKFIWMGQYRPCYPEPWATQQRDLGRAPDPVLTNVDRLSWNGVWTLDFDLPIFTWIHRVQDLGWIYR